MRPDDERYFERIESQLDDAFDVARAARAQGKDPETEIEIPVARDMADRVENILGIPGVAERVRELEADYSREEAALELVTDFVEGTVGDFDTRAGKIEGAVRTAVALLTEGVVAAPIEGIDRVEILENDDGTEFINVYYAGPIRSAGGTAQALSVLVADYARALLGVDEFKPRDDEVERYAEEISLYDDETGLQYTPKDAETKFITRHLPIMLDGEATSDEEVSGFRDLERIDTNSARGGMCLVLAEGIALKAPKIQRYTRELDEISWPWLQDLIDGSYKEDHGTDSDADDAADTSDGEETSGDGKEASGDDEGSDTGDEESDETGGAGPPRPEPSGKYLRDLIAGRPVFGHPSESGGFRLRYGRARNHGFATAGVHPATMHLVDDFLATGTQIKTERPGKAAGVVPVDSIEGPTVRLATGDVRRVDDPEEAREIRNGVEEILDLGEYLVNYGEFVENNQPLAPASYTVEWWVQEFADTAANVQAFRDDPRVSLDEPEPAEALEWATEYDCPLHPAYTYLWHDVSVADADALADALAAGEITTDTPSAVADGGVAAATGEAGGDDALVIEQTGRACRVLERLLVEHTQREETVHIETFRPLARQLGLDAELRREWGLDDVSEAARTYADGENAIQLVNEVAPFAVRERAPTRIGNRMGRPEKSESRELSPAVHTLFPVGEAGGSQRSMEKAAGTRGGGGEIEATVGERQCPSCGTDDYHVQCPSCGTHTEPHYECDTCGQVCTPDEAGRVECDRCDREVRSPDAFTLDLDAELHDALDELNERRGSFEILKGVKGLSSEHKTPEPLAKGILRAKHDVSAFKDGTVRYDMTDLPVTSVRPAELDVTVADFRELGYETDVNGDPLRHDDQLVELNVQDVILSDGAARHMMQTADFVDDLLVRYYDAEPFYEIEDRDDLVGELVFGMAPHTSAAVVGRVVGFTSAAVGYAHPYFHAAKRRNCFHPETAVWYTDENGETRHERIEQVVERYLDPETAREDDFGTLVTELPEELDVRVPSYTEDGDQTTQRVEAVSKHPAPDHEITIRTRSGRELTVTPEHELYVYEAGADGLVAKEARQIETTDHLVTPKNVDTVAESADETTEFDLLAAFAQSDAIDNDRLMVRGLDKDRLYDLFESTFGDGWEGTFYPLKSTAQILDVSEKTLGNYLYRESIPLDTLSECFDDLGSLRSFVPDDVSLGVKSDNTDIDRRVELTEHVATLLGYYTAEGFTRTGQTSKGPIYQTTFCGVESEAREFFESVLRSEFGVDPYFESDTKVTASGRLLQVFFESVLDAGIGATDKRVPAVLFDAPARIRGAYLSGYFSGDGSVATDRLEIDATTTSEELADDILAVLTSLGIKATRTVEEPVPLHTKFPDFYDERDMSMTARCYRISVRSEDAEAFATEVGFHLSRKQRVLREQCTAIDTRSRRVFDGGAEAYVVDPVESTQIAETDTEYVYDLTVEQTHSLIANDLAVKQCDGDEDCVMLLMDGLLNFSKQYLPDQRGGQMDAPLVMSSRIDPTEIDDEAHNMDIVRQYPRSFYEATREMADPGEVDVQIAADTLGTDDQYHGFDHTHDVTDLHMGPDLSAYKTLGSMEEKMDAQLNLSRRLRAVDETDVAERIIEYHFLPDLIGNLRAFARQETRCLDCGEKYRRMPLTGDCRECGGGVNLTVHRGSVNKYMDTAREVAEEFDCRGYTKQRLEVLNRTLESIFENDKNKPTSIEDFM